MVDTLASFGRKMDLLAERLGGDAALKALTTKLGVMAKGEAQKAAVADLGGDNKFSGWAKAPLLTRFNDISPGVIEFLPTPRARGPWTVAERGRRRGHKFSRKRGRNVGWGPTQGKGTWSDAVTKIEREMPGKVNDEVVKHLRQTFGGR